MKKYIWEGTGWSTRVYPLVLFGATGTGLRPKDKTNNISQHGWHNHVNE